MYYTEVYCPLRLELSMAIVNPSALNSLRMNSYNHGTPPNPKLPDMLPNSFQSECRELHH